MAVIIGRNEAVGLGRESVAGTPVSASVWIPKKSGSVNPSFEEAVDDSGWGIIDEVYDSATVKNMTKVTLGGIARDDFFGHLLMGAMGTHTAVFMTKATSVTGTAVRGNTCYQGANFGAATWTGKLKKILTVGVNTYHILSTLTGSFASGTNVKEATADTWTLVAPDSTTYSAVKGHLFERANTNTHPTYTLYTDEAIQASYAPYSMVNTLKITAQVGDFVTFESEYMGKKLVTTTAQSPSYTAGNAFLAKNTNVFFANDEAGLNAASAVCLQTFNLNINKNLADIQCFGSDDIDSIHNQQFTIDGDLEAIYDSTTIRDYVVNSTKKACRVAMINTSATALVTGIYPSMYIDMSKLGFKERSKSDDLNSITTQSAGFTGQYKAGDLMTLEILLLNSQATAY